MLKFKYKIRVSPGKGEKYYNFLQKKGLSIIIFFRQSEIRYRSTEVSKEELLSSKEELPSQKANTEGNIIDSSRKELVG